MPICLNDKIVEIFAHRFHYIQNPFYKFFALNLLFQYTSYSLVLKYSSFLFKFSSFAFYTINFWFKISKICPKILHFSQISHSRGNTAVETELYAHKALTLKRLCGSLATRADFSSSVSLGLFIFTACDYQYSPSV